MMLQKLVGNKKQLGRSLLVVLFAAVVTCGSGYFEWSSFGKTPVAINSNVFYAIPGEGEYTLARVQPDIRNEDIRNSYAELVKAESQYSNAKKEYDGCADDEKMNLKVRAPYVKRKILYASWSLLVAEQVVRSNSGRWVTAAKYFEPGLRHCKELEGELTADLIKHFFAEDPAVLIHYDTVKFRKKNILSARDQNNGALENRVQALRDIALAYRALSNHTLMAQRDFQLTGSVASIDQRLRKAADTVRSIKEIVAKNSDDSYFLNLEPGLPTFDDPVAIPAFSSGFQTEMHVLKSLSLFRSAQKLNYEERISRLSKAMRSADLAFAEPGGEDNPLVHFVQGIILEALGLATVQETYTDVAVRKKAEPHFTSAHQSLEKAEELLDATPTAAAVPLQLEIEKKIKQLVGPQVWWAEAQENIEDARRASEILLEAIKRQSDRKLWLEYIRFRLRTNQNLEQLVALCDAVIPVSGDSTENIFKADDFEALILRAATTIAVVRDKIAKDKELLHPGELQPDQTKRRSIQAKRWELQKHLTGAFDDLERAITLAPAIVGLSADDGSGNFTLTLGDQSSDLISVDVTADVIKSRLEALRGITDVRVDGSGTDQDPWSIAFVNPSGGKLDVSQLSGSGDGVKVSVDVRSVYHCKAYQSLAFALQRILNDDPEFDFAASAGEALAMAKDARRILAKSVGQAQLVRLEQLPDAEALLAALYADGFLSLMPANQSSETISRGILAFGAAIDLQTRLPHDHSGAKVIGSPLVALLSSRPANVDGLASVPEQLTRQAMEHFIDGSFAMTLGSPAGAIQSMSQGLDVLRQQASSAGDPPLTDALALLGLQSRATIRYLPDLLLSYRVLAQLQSADFENDSLIPEPEQMDRYHDSVATAQSETLRLILPSLSESTARQGDFETLRLAVQNIPSPMAGLLLGRCLEARVVGLGLAPHVERSELMELARESLQVADKLFDNDSRERYSLFVELRQAAYRRLSRFDDYLEESKSLGKSLQIAAAQRAVKAGLRRHPTASALWEELVELGLVEADLLVDENKKQAALNRLLQVVEYQEHYAISGDWQRLLNAARIHEQLCNWQQAMSLLSKAQDQASNASPSYTVSILASKSRIRAHLSAGN